MKSKIPHYLGHRKRLKDRFIKNPNSLADYEIIELLLGYVIRGKDVKPQAKKVIEKLNGIENIFQINDKIDGIGSESVLFFKIIKELYKRCEYAKIKSSESILNTPSAVYNFIKYEIGFDETEKLVAIFLDSKGGVKEYNILSNGSVNESYFPPKEIAKMALIKNAVGVIIAHNHPSGNLKASNSDIRYTKNVKDALNVVDIALIDHIIVSHKGFLSFKQEGLL
ncbi:DNA repair protein RadC [Deferribacter thermophilus]|uniref:JAB domain-containing protein n=1 Tax=Deferribacter thermophilus TaxID=53573 RepID=UPI003C1F5A6C